MPDKIRGFSPVFDENSRVLILGSFPSVKSRRVSFYYGNKQNRFWPMLERYFGESAGLDAAQRKAFVLRHGIALWDIVVACTIQGSADASIRDAELADLDEVLRAAPIRRILLNGGTAYLPLDANEEQMRRAAEVCEFYDKVCKEEMIRHERCGENVERAWFESYMIEVDFRKKSYRIERSKL